MNTLKLKSNIAKASVYLSAIITIGILVILVMYILIKGIPHITPSLFSIKYTSNNVSLFPALINTLIITGLALLFAVPLGIFSAIYMVEYANKGNKLVSIVRMTTETLQGIPSIVYGLFGTLFFVTIVFKTYCLLAGALTLSIMILPLIMRTTEEALKSIPDSFREGSLGLGAGKLRTVFKIILPSAAHGIFGGVILSVGRIVGETVALIYTAGSMPKVPENLLGSGRTLSVHMYSLWNEGLNVNESYATAVVLLTIVLLLNFISSYIEKKVQMDK